MVLILYDNVVIHSKSVASELGIAILSASITSMNQYDDERWLLI